MTPVEFAAAVAVLLCAASVGVVAHEFAHALTLRALGVSYRIEWLPDDGGGPLQSAAMGAFARVTPLALSADTPGWRLRVASMAPLALAVPVALVALGVVGDPVGVGDPIGRMAALGWLACAVPSPSDFAVLWHAESALPTADPEQSG